MRPSFPTLLILVTVAAARAEFQQKIVEQLSLDDPRVPAAVRATSVTTPWVHSERGPVRDLQWFAPGEKQVPAGRRFKRGGGASGKGIQWLGGPEGAARFDPGAVHPWDRWQYFAGPRWLRDDRVRNIVPEDSPGADRVWIRTDTGISLIEWRSMTLVDKANHFEDLIERHHLRHGFVADCRLRAPGVLEESFTVDNDNDGLWTAMYLAAQSYCYAVTGSPVARDRATRSFEALVRLLDFTGHAGFPARSLAAAGEPHDNGEWHATADGEWQWKGDTSSDEIVGHYYGHALFHDLVANEEQKQTVRRVLRAITDHLIQHDFELLDLDGNPTRWGQWSERYFATPEGRYERALRSLELLAFLKTAHRITGDDRYARAYADRVARGYAEYLPEYRRWPGGGEINFSDDELAYLSIDPLLRYETDRSARRRYVAFVRALWSGIRSDRNPLWNYMSSAAGAGRLSSDLRTDSIKTLERIPWLPIDWRVRNSRRTDVHLRPEKDRFGRQELRETLPPDERPQHKWNGNPYVPDGGGGGLQLECGTYFLLPYWMGRYHGWISE